MAAAPPVNHILIKDMKPAQRGIDCDCIVLQKESDPVTTREGDTIYKFLIADRTGVILLSIWNALGQYVKNGDILRLCGW
ncbi:hypothetical protein BDB00DRAFT_851652 [Zychaea mexicana]|uniref:uncharacterized protein n=1 Tax=Zychaea mexicana TaxID=64656 RepID=UPI0022FDF0B2|nr:uncharacterized protein BDB00DRAFT_851652 [Zychaea mexicana]KAI9485049.1 hypothetical protein BDB00DRAFT_851652 [Zychaea mexicana]